MKLISLLGSKLFNLIFIGVVAAVTIATVITIALVVESPTDPTIAPDVTTPDENGSGSTDDTTVTDDGTTPDGGSGDGGSGSKMDNSIILKLLNSQPIIYEQENEEDLISEGFMQLNQH